jgi:hypothetical protein
MEARLRDRSLPPDQRREALEFLVHFVADLHQPLHVADHGDRGGNMTQVQFFGRGTNLHAVWDGQMLEQRGWDEAKSFEHLERRMASLDLAGMEKGFVVDWAMEGHRLAAADAYRLPRNRRLSTAYLEANLPAVDLALIRAGVRLAAVLNEALAAYRVVSGPAPVGPGVFSDLQAAAHVGEVATIVGTVVTVVRSRAGNIYLNFGADYPHQTFSAAVLNPGGAGFDELERLAGRRVRVTGMIKRHQGRVEIVILKPEQLTIMP